MDYTETIEAVGKAVDGIGVGVTVIGVVAALLTYARSLQRRNDVPPGAENPYRRVRRRVGRSVLLGLEILVAGDIIRTVAVDPTFVSVGVLAVVVAVRTFLSMMLEVEITARWPWQREAGSAS